MVGIERNCVTRNSQTKDKRSGGVGNVTSVQLKEYGIWKRRDSWIGTKGVIIQYSGVGSTGYSRDDCSGSSGREVS